MSRLDELIRELCPDGVEYKRLEECCTLVKGKTPIQKAEPGEYPLVVTTSERRTCSTYQFDKPTVCIPLISSRGHGVASLNSVYYQEGKFALGNILCGVTPNDEDYLSAKFLFEYLNYKKDALLVPLMKGGANVSLTVDSLRNVKIPIPPKEVQYNIVEKLSILEEYISTMREELYCRKKQYEYYLPKLLKGNASCSKIQFGKIIEFQNGFAFKSKLFKDNGNPIVRITNIKKNYISEEELVYFDKMDYSVDMEQYQINPGDIIIAMSGATTGKIALNNTKKIFYLNQRVGKIIPDATKIDREYLFYLLQSYTRQIYEISEGTGAQPNLSTEKFKKMEVEIPELCQQKEIVKRIRPINELCYSQQYGMEKAIQKRCEQYEYCCSKLLDFKEIYSEMKD